MQQHLSVLAVLLAAQTGRRAFYEASVCYTSSLMAVHKLKSPKRTFLQKTSAVGTSLHVVGLQWI